MIMFNIEQGSHKDDKREHTLHSLYPIVEPDSYIDETPSKVTHLSVNVRHHLDSITLSIVYLEANTVDFPCEVITARIHNKLIS